MEGIEYVYTFGMSETEITERLSAGDVGILSLAAGGRAYAVPVGYVHEGSSLYLRLAATPGSEKMRFVEGTREACFVLWDLDGGSWSVIATGPLVSSNADGFDRPRINREFSRLRIFDEPIESVEVTVHELRIESLTGRKMGR